MIIGSLLVFFCSLQVVFGIQCLYTSTNGIQNNITCLNKCCSTASGGCCDISATKASNMSPAVIGGIAAAAFVCCCVTIISIITCCCKCFCKKNKDNSSPLQPYPAYNSYPQASSYGGNQPNNQMYPNYVNPVNANSTIYPNLNNLQQQPPNYNYQNQPTPINNTKY